MTNQFPPLVDPSKPDPMELKKQHEEYLHLQAKKDWSKPIMEAYRASSDEHVWLKPATWIAALTMVGGLLTSVYFFGQSNAKKITRDEFQQRFEKAPTRAEFRQSVSSKADKEVVIRLEGELRLVKQNFLHLQQRQKEFELQMRNKINRLMEENKNRKRRR